MTNSQQKWSKAMLDEEKELVKMLDEMDDHIEHHRISPPDPKILAELQEAARNYNLTRKTVTFKPQETVLRKFKERAEKEGIPYQALLNSVMKKYAEWSLVQKEEMYVVK